ncbi:hypothetical protein Tco_1292280 [Tanacetum coccineum]
MFPLNPPTRTDEQIVPRSQWLTIGKSNLLFNAQKIQKNPIFQISVDILKNTNFFQALTASANVPAITGNSSGRQCISDSLLSPHLTLLCYLRLVHTVLDFVIELGYHETVGFLSLVYGLIMVAFSFEAILSLLNQCLTGKMSGSDKPRHPVLQMLWGIVTQTNVDHAELIWEEFTQGIQTFFSHKAKPQNTVEDNPRRKATPLSSLMDDFPK